jgi:hypothetical protein
MQTGQDDGKVASGNGNVAMKGGRCERCNTYLQGAGAQVKLRFELIDAIGRFHASEHSEVWCAGCCHQSFQVLGTPVMDRPRVEVVSAN